MTSEQTLKDLIYDEIDMNNVHYFETSYFEEALALDEVADDYKELDFESE